MMYWFGMSCFLIGGYTGYIYADLISYDKELGFRKLINEKNRRIGVLEDEGKDAKNQQLDNG
jgi:hypothetical protein